MSESGPEFIPDEERPVGLLSSDERQAILVRADLRKRSQDFKVDALNLNLPETSEAHKEKYERTLALVKREADGSEIRSREEAERYLEEREEGTRAKAETMEDIAPEFSAYLYAVVAKNEQTAGREFAPTLSRSEGCQDRASHIPKLVPANMLSDAITLGIQRREAVKLPMPAMDKIAQATANNKALLESYALVLEEGQREKFLSHLPEDSREEASRVLDVRVSQVLHASLVEKGTPEEEQRRRVRMRLFSEVREMLNDPNYVEKNVAKQLGQALGELGEDSRQLLLELIRDESETRKTDADREPGYLPRVMKIMLDNFEDWRANDIIMRTAADEGINKHLSIYLFGKLVDKGYISKDVAEWWRVRQEEARSNDRSLQDEDFRLGALKKVVSELGVVPSGQVMEFVCDDSKWQGGEGVLSLDERIEKIKDSQAEFSEAKDNLSLCRLLSSDQNKAMTYFLLYGGQDRFNLINNYDFGKFWEMINIISNPRSAENSGLTPLQVHEAPIRMFEQSLSQSGMAPEQTRSIVTNLRAGHFPLENFSQAHQEVSFEASESAALKNANAEIGRVLGQEQLGVILLFPLYREYLEQDSSETARQYLDGIASKTTFADRLQLIEEIDKSFPDFRARAKEDIEEPWVKFGEKMLMELTLDQVFSENELPVKGEDLLPRLDAKRIDLKRINKELLVLLKGENKAVADIGKEICKKRKARQGLVQGLERQTDGEKRAELQEKIDDIDREITDLERRKADLGELRANDRFADMTIDEKKAEIERISQEVIALTEKSPSAIFTYITMQVLGEERLRESDINLVKELESHLQGPFQTISDFLSYDRGKGGERKQTKVGLQYLDKTDRLMTMVRFADSKICCFSSSNYEMRVQHNTPNKFWVASINADPMSFVISIEQPQPQIAESSEGRQVKENIGFIFGNFGIDESGQIALMLNGIYYAPGIEDERQVEAILDGVEKIFSGLPVKKVVVATQYGGSVKMSEGYSKSAVELTRLRALDDGGGRPESHIYDDLGTGTDLNKPHIYRDFVWHKEVE